MYLQLSNKAVCSCSGQSDRHGNTRLAFDVAAEHLNIPVRQKARPQIQFANDAP